MAVEAEHDIAALDATLACRAVLVRARDQRAFGLRQSERLREVRRHFLNLDAQPSAHDAPMRLQLIHHVARHVDRNREADAVVGAGAAVDRRVDPDDLALGVDQRATRVAGVDRRVGLNEIVVVAAEDSSFGADDSRRHRHADVERIADCDYPVADVGGIGIAERRDRQRVLGVDFDKPEIGLRILADHLRGKLALVLQRHVDFVGVTDHVIVGQDVAVRRHDHARAQPVLLVFALTALSEVAAQLIERIAPPPAGGLAP